MSFEGSDLLAGFTIPHQSQVSAWELVGEFAAALFVRQSSSGQASQLVVNKGQVFSPDGNRFILTFAGREGAIPVWETTSGKELMVLKGSHPICTAAFSPDGRRIVAGSITGRMATLWDAGAARELLNFPQQSEVTAVAFSPDGQRLLIACADGSSKIYPAETWDQ